ncbi:hypothetical protein BV20DRAFT_1003329 [Pilatotrama ljubarskyi]|nr:hypothetical protein BV20DRAFT_1003329 [Pilatotrama ljubarskyi]
MTDLVGDSQLTAEFVKFLNGQLKECRDQLQRYTQENTELREQLGAIRSGVPLGSPPPPHHGRTVSDLDAEVASLKEQLAVARQTAEAHANEAAMWRERYQKTKTVEGGLSLSELQRKAATDKLKNGLQEGLVRLKSAAKVTRSSTSQYQQFTTFMSKLSGSTASGVDALEPRVVFDTPKLQILSKAAVNACDGGFAFFGGLLNWCASPSENALLVCPEHHFTPNPGNDGGTKWSHPTEWSSLIGQRREVFDTDGAHLTYAGTFLFHAGPKALRLQDFPSPLENKTLGELARRTFNPANKSQRAKAKAYLHILSELYTEGTATVQVLGLQRVGFNDKFFQILKKAYEKRGRTSARVRARSETQRSLSPADWNTLDDGLGEEDATTTGEKRGRDDDVEEDGDEFGAGPSKKARSDGDGWLSWL